MYYCYCRVSTLNQTNENQRLTIKKYLKLQKINEVKWVTESISGCKDIKKRALGTLISSMQEGDTLIITELSRLGRSLMMILDVLQEMLNKNIKVIAIKENFNLGDDIQSKVLAFAFGLSAEIERRLISERTKMGLERARRQRKQIGWPKGLPRKPKLYGKGAYIKRELKKGRSKSSLARELNVCWATLSSFVKLKKLA